MIKITLVRGNTYWINPRHVVQMEYRKISDYMYKNYEMPDGVTHFTLIRTVHGREYEVNATVEELLELINPHLQ